MNINDGRSNKVTAQSDGFANLARAILVQAIRDRKKFPIKYGHDCKMFFESAWYESCCDLAGYNPDALREKLVKLELK